MTTFLVQMVDKPTRGNKILDLVCISDPSCIDKLEVKESFALGDHRSEPLFTFLAIKQKPMYVLT